MSTRPEGGTKTFGSTTKSGLVGSTRLVSKFQLTGTPSRASTTSGTMLPSSARVCTLMYVSAAASMMR